MSDGTSDFEGTLKLLRVLFRKVAFGTDTIPSGGNLDIIVDVVPELFHAHYLPSVFQVTDPGGTPVDIFYFGPGATEPGLANIGAVTISLYKKRKTGSAAANQQEVHLYMANPLGGDVDVDYQVYRILGLI